MRILFVCCALFLFSSCNTTAQLNGGNKTVTCSFSYENQTINWEKIDNIARLKLKPSVRKTQLPTKFTAYLLNEKRLKAVLESANQVDKNAVIVIPIENKCITFKVSASGTMSKDLAAKFPNIISLKGIAVNSETISLRIDYKDGDLKAEINEQGQIYFIDTWPGKKQNYFLMYKKEDAGYEKVPFKSY